MLINRRNFDDLKKLNYHVHDKWFAVDKVVYDEANREFRLFFGDNKNSYDECLKVAGVLNCDIRDTEKVGIYDIYRLSIDRRASKIYIEGCIPIKIILDVTEDFEISTSPVAKNRSLKI